MSIHIYLTMINMHFILFAFIKHLKSTFVIYHCFALSNSLLVEIRFRFIVHLTGYANNSYYAWKLAKFILKLYHYCYIIINYSIINIIVVFFFLHKLTQYICLPSLNKILNVLDI